MTGLGTRYCGDPKESGHWILNAASCSSCSKTSGNFVRDFTFGERFGFEVYERRASVESGKGTLSEFSEAALFALSTRWLSMSLTEPRGEDFALVSGGYASTLVEPVFMPAGLPRI